MSDLTKTRLVELADEKLSDAKLLMRMGRFTNAYYIAGYAAETMLKAIVVRQFKAETLPNKKLVNDLHTHSIETLAKLAGLGADLAESQSSDPEFAARWQKVTDWSEESRYKLSSEADASQIIDALEDADRGVLQWLRQYL